MQFTLIENLISKYKISILKYRIFISKLVENRFVSEYVETDCNPCLNLGTKVSIFNILCSSEMSILKIIYVHLLNLEI